MSGSREVELKLELPPAEVARLRERNFNLLGGNDGVKQHLMSVYFDTYNRALRKRGLTLQIQSDGERHLQTVKQGDATPAGMFDRLEWETEIEGDAPDLKAAVGTPVGDILSGKRTTKPLAPIFETVVDRTIWRVTQDGSEIEVALDEGRVIAGGSASPIAELELVLRRGSPANLFAFARNFDGVSALKIAVLTISERGYALADDDEPSSFKAAPIAIKPGMPAAEAFRTVAHACIRHFRLNEPLLIATRSPEPMHQARVAMRRLRSALSLFSPIVADHEYEKLKRHLRDVSHQLGEARNLDVYIARTAMRNAADTGGLPTVALDPAGPVKVERERAYERAIATLESECFRQFMFDIVSWIEAGSWRTLDEPKRQVMRAQTIEDFAVRALKRGRRKVKHGGRHLDRLSPEERHRIRIDAKKLRYASEFFSSLVTDRKHRRLHKAFIAALEDLQGCLGDLNDIQTGDEIAAELARPEAAPNGGFVSAPDGAGHPHEQNERAAALLSSAGKAHQRLSGAKPFWKGLTSRNSSRHLSQAHSRQLRSRLHD